MRNFHDLHRARRRQFRAFTALIIAVQVMVVVGIVWGLTHPEAIGAYIGRLLSGVENAR